MTELETARVLAMLSATWPERYGKGDRNLEAARAAYHLALDDLPYAAVEAAVRAGLREWKFFPAPAEIRAKAEATGGGMAGEAYWLGEYARFAPAYDADDRVLTADDGRIVRRCDGVRPALPAKGA